MTKIDHNWSVLTNLMLVYGGEVWRWPSDCLRLASVAPMVPRVFPLRRVLADFTQIGYLGSSKVRNLGCGISSGTRSGGLRCVRVWEIEGMHLFWVIIGGLKTCILRSKCEIWGYWGSRRSPYLLFGIAQNGWTWGLLIPGGVLISSLKVSDRVLEVDLVLP